MKAHDPVGPDGYTDAEREQVELVKQFESEFVEEAVTIHDEAIKAGLAKVFGRPVETMPDDEEGIKALLEGHRLSWRGMDHGAVIYLLNDQPIAIVHAPDFSDGTAKLRYSLFEKTHEAGENAAGTD